MCGRISLGTSIELIAGRFGLSYPPRVDSRWNISPGQPILAVREGEEGRNEACFLSWGLIPSWAKERAVGYKMINARAETVADKPSFRAAYRARRCLVVADGFYEWRRSGKLKQPFHFRRSDFGLLALAGIWENWIDPVSRENIASCALLTTDANELMIPIHHRMPVLIEADESEAWLKGESGDLKSLIASRAWPQMEAVAVSDYVNNARNQGPECVLAATPQPE